MALTPRYQRTIYIGKQNVSDVVSSCSFSFVREGGCDGASLTIDRTRLDDFAGIEINDTVKIWYGSTAQDPWWSGMVTELTTSLEGGLAVQCTGLRLRLSETFPVGVYGVESKLGTPENLTYLLQSSGGALGPGTYVYYVTALDKKGETLPSSPVSVSIVTGSSNLIQFKWDKVNNAIGYRVYKTSGTVTVYFEASSEEHTDTGETTGISGEIPVVHTATEPMIESGKIQDVVNNLLNVWLPAGLKKGTIMVPDDFDLDFYDLTEGSANLFDVLKTLAEMAGPLYVFGVDGAGRVYFRKGVTSFSSTTGIVLRVGGNKTGSEENRKRNLLTGVTRSKSRDGVTIIRIEGEEEVNEPERVEEVNAESDSEDTWPDPSIAVGDSWWKKTNFHTLANQMALAGLPKLTYSLLRGSYSGGAVTLAVAIPELVALHYIMFTWKGGSPVPRAPFTQVSITAVCDDINSRIAAIREAEKYKYSQLDHLTRSREVVRYIPGIRTLSAAKLVACNFAMKYKPVPDRWNLRVENPRYSSSYSMPFFPGLDMVRIITGAGNSHDLHIQGLSIDFGSIPVADLAAGDPEYTISDERRDAHKVTDKLSQRTTGGTGGDVTITQAAVATWLPWGGE